MKFLASFLILFVGFYFAAFKAEAAQVPQFSSCLNPQGQVKVSYDSGTHGIAGNTGSFQGKDTVYILSSDTLMQCFCATDGKGIQSNWWKVSSLSESEVNVLKSQGWQLVPNGSLWGLDNAQYLVINSEYICKSSQTSCCLPTTDIPGPGGGGGQGGSVLGVSAGSVLGLASTGNTKFLLSILVLSASSLILGIILKLRKISLFR